MSTKTYREYQEEKKEHMHLLRERYYYLKEEITYQKHNGSFYRILSPIEVLNREIQDILTTMRAFNQ